MNHSWISGLMGVLVLGIVGVLPAWAGEVVIARDGKCEYQIVVPAAREGDRIGEGVAQTARLMQAAFKANRYLVDIVAEPGKAAGKPAIFLGDTAFARANGFDPSTLKSWGYCVKVVGRDVFIAGRDMPAPAASGVNKAGIEAVWDRLGTTKGAADFMRQYMGVRFLFPDLPARTPIRAGGGLDFSTSPAVEFVETLTISVPGELDVKKSPMLETSFGYPQAGGFYEIANNRFPPVDMFPGGHTYPRAVPVEKYGGSHPEYFALSGGERLSTQPQYCVSNPAVQELFFQDMLSQADRGFGYVDLGQGDGYRICECKECAQLFETGSDWSEKLWLLHLKLAERFLKERPEKMVTLMAYSLTETPPKSFKKFPANVRILLCGSNEEDFAKWAGYEVPGGYAVSVYNWCPNLGTRYTPMRTPRFVEEQARRFGKYRVQSVFRDGSGLLFGLEGPVYYTMGRMYDDPLKLRARDLVEEYCSAAYGVSAPMMRRFFEQLYEGIELYSQFIGTRSPGWAYQTIDGRGRKYVTDPFALLGFLYPPALLASLERELSAAEQRAEKTTDTDKPTDKVKARLALVRREFDYLKATVKVVHLYRGFEMQPDRPARERVLEAVDARDAMLEGYYDRKSRGAAKDWAASIFPPNGHTLPHLRLSIDGYQEPYRGTPLNWNTRMMREAPLPGEKASSGPGGAATPFDRPPPLVDDLEEPVRKR